jgi:hypothetical protein
VSQQPDPHESPEVIRAGQPGPFAGEDKKQPPGPAPEGYRYVWDPLGDRWVLVKEFDLGGEGVGGPGGGGFGGFGGGGGGGVDPMVSAGWSLYFELWGQKAPAGYIEKLVGQGMNLLEIELHERSKPAFSKTFAAPAAEEEAGTFAVALARLMGIAV